MLSDCYNHVVSQVMHHACNCHNHALSFMWKRKTDAVRKFSMIMQAFVHTNDSAVK
jgi:hypothetical protein